MIKCSCGYENRDGRRICYKCGQELRVSAHFEQAQTEESFTNVTSPATLPKVKPLSTKETVIVLVVLFVILSYVYDAVHKSGPSDEDAYVMSEVFVKDILKCPSSAEFALTSEATITDLGAGSYRVESYVDSQNSFGAMMRTYYTCKLTKVDEENWHLDSLTFDDD